MARLTPPFMVFVGEEAVCKIDRAVCHEVDCRECSKSDEYQDTGRGRE